MKTTASALERAEAATMKPADAIVEPAESAVRSTTAKSTEASTSLKASALTKCGNWHEGQHDRDRSDNQNSGTDRPVHGRLQYP